MAFICFVNQRAQKQGGEITNMLIYESVREMKIKGLLINDV